MKAYVRSHIQAHSIQRISTALATYTPEDITIVNYPDMADLVVHLVVGVGNFHAIPIDRLIDDEVRHGQRYAIVQCCLMSTEEKTPDFWKALWESAEVVWSYLDLRTFAPTYNFHFYHAPLGAESAIFTRRGVPRDITMLTTGFVADSECVQEVSDAVQRVGGRHVHVGPDFHLGPHSTAVIGLSDYELAILYARSQFVAGLRRDEGFELPAAEGLLCGARPIMFDAPHYRQWFDGLAEFVPEDRASVVTHAIETILRRGGEVTADESRRAVNRYNWRTIIEGFWASVRSHIYA